MQFKQEKFGVILHELVNLSQFYNFNNNLKYKIKFTNNI
jgi:hypothetical protein